MDGGLKRFSTTLLLISIVLAFFIVFNANSTTLSVSMLGYVAMAAFLLFLINFKNIGYEFIIAAFTVKDTLIGAAVGLAFILINSLNSAITIGAPQFLGLAAQFQFAAIVIIAPIVEEFFFRGAIYPAIYNAGIFGRFQRNNYVAIPLQALIFAGFHFFVYGGILGLSNAIGLFLGAFIFGVVAGLLNAEQPKFGFQYTLERTIVAHMIFNFYLLNLTVKFLSIGGLK